ncbi:MAG: hypothetical protein C0483_25535 [Pirellula sp.]|nr:hypothetical protein [Pirellula sp.]
MRFSEGFSAPPPKNSAVTAIFIGPLGHGVGLAADILAHVAEAARHAVVRDRRISARSANSAAPRDGFLHVVRMEQGASRPGLVDVVEPADLVVAWNVEAALAFAHLLKSPEDLYILATDRVPAWRRDLNGKAQFGSHADSPQDRHAVGALSAVRALGMISRRLPFHDSLWRHIVPQHVPSQLSQAAVDHFFAVAW